MLPTTDLYHMDTRSWDLYTMIPVTLTDVKDTITFPAEFITLSSFLQKEANALSSLRPGMLSFLEPTWLSLLMIGLTTWKS